MGLVLQFFFGILITIFSCFSWHMYIGLYRTPAGWYGQQPYLGPANPWPWRNMGVWDGEIAPKWGGITNAQLSSDSILSVLCSYSGKKGGRLENSEFKSQIKIADKNPLLRGIFYIPRKNLQIGLRIRALNKTRPIRSTMCPPWWNNCMTVWFMSCLTSCFNFFWNSPYFHWTSLT